MEAPISLNRKTFLDYLSRDSDLILAGGILAILLVIVVPLPSLLLDALLILNIGGSTLLLLSVVCAARPLDFSTFPSALLLVTFFRLALNIASTRLILGNADTGGVSAAGEVIEAFSAFVAGSNLIVGFVVFVILVVVQFIVITKGTTRISEVAARFSLDAMPGKQLSIDGDLAAGTITEAEARKLRRYLSEEASFYGSMDGASKFVRGEAVAGIFIVLTNLLGGFFLGTLYYGMDLGTAASVFTRLSLGDGFVTQVPALMVSVATALLVTRSANKEVLGRELGSQLFLSERTLFAAAAFLVLLLPSGLPVWGLLMGAALCCGSGYLALRHRSGRDPLTAEPEGQNPSKSESPDARARSLLVLEPIELEIGFRLVGLVDDAQGGDLMARLSRVRENVAVEMGLVVPAIKVIDNTRLHPTEYSIKLRANRVGRWRVRPGKWLVSAEAGPPHGIQGSSGPDPVTGKPGLWIDDAQCSQAADMGYRVRKVSEVIADHLDSLIRMHASEVLTREEVSRLIHDLRKRAPALVDELIPGTLKLGDVHKVLQLLLREQVSIRDLETILETLADHGDRTRDTRELTERVRRALSRSICISLAKRDGSIHAALFDPALEEFLQGSMEKSERGLRLAIEPEMAETLVDSIVEQVSRLGNAKQPPVLACSGLIRSHIRDLIAGRVPLCSVLAYEEVGEEFRLESSGTIVLERDVLGIGRETVLNRMNS